MALQVITQELEQPAPDTNLLPGISHRWSHCAVGLPV